MNGRCSACGELGHRRTAHHEHADQRPAKRMRGAPPIWFVVVRDVSGAIDGWAGPFYYNVALAIARRIDARPIAHRLATKISRRQASFQGEPMQIPDGWRDYDIVSTDRVPRTSREGCREAA